MVGVNIREKSINVFSFLFLATILCTMGYNAYDMLPLQLLSYATECVLIVYTFIKSKGNGKRIISMPVVLVSSILIVNYIVSPNEPEYTDLLKFLGYLGCFKYGDSLAVRYEKIKINRFLLFVIIFIPAFLVAFVDTSVMKNMFFRASNGFVYLGVAMGGFYLLIKGCNKESFVKSIIISAFYILICTSLGVVVAAFMVFLLLNLRKSHIPYLFIGSLALVFAIFYIDIPLFIRMRDVFHVWQYVYESRVGNIKDVDFYEINNLDRVGERNDASSSVWRLVQWSKVFSAYISEIWMIPFGMGAGFSVKLTGLYPHNDYLLILVEYGLVVFTYFFKFVLKVYKRLKNERMLIYFILTMLFYHFTENLLNNFPPSAILYFLIGWSLNKRHRLRLQVKHERRI